MIYDYIYEPDEKPDVKFLTLKGPHPKNLHFGFEYEINRKIRPDGQFVYGSGRRDVRKFNRQNNDWTYWKRDGSCDVEINSLPFNWNFYQTHREKFRRIFKNIISISSSIRNCGFHIHMSREYLSVDAVNKLLHLIKTNRGFFTLISGRGHISLQKYANISSTPSHVYYAWKETLKYAAIRLTPVTIEFRLFKGTRSSAVVQQYLEFCYALAIFVKGTETYLPNLKDFLHFLKKNKFKLACALVESRYNNKKKKKKTKVRRAEHVLERVTRV